MSVVVILWMNWPTTCLHRHWLPIIAGTNTQAKKPTNPNKHKPNKRTKSTKISSLFPKRGNRNTKRTEKHKNKTHGKTYNKSPRRINHKATKSKTNTGTTALERSVEQTTVGFKALLQLAYFTLGPDATLNTETHKSAVSIKAPNSVSASKRKHKNQINNYNKQRRVLMANSTVCQSKWKPIVEPRRAKPKIYRQAKDISSSQRHNVKSCLVLFCFCVFQSFKHCDYLALGRERVSAFRTCSICAYLVLSVSSSTWCLGRAAACDCGTAVYLTR